MTKKYLYIFLPICVSIFMAIGMIIGSYAHTQNIAGVSILHAQQTCTTTVETWYTDGIGWETSITTICTGGDTGGGGAGGGGGCTPKCNGPICGESDGCSGTCGSPDNYWCNPQTVTCSDGSAAPNNDASQCPVCKFSCGDAGASCGTFIQCGQTFDCGLCPPIGCEQAPVTESSPCPGGDAGYIDTVSQCGKVTEVNNFCTPDNGGGGIPTSTTSTITVSENVSASWTINPGSVTRTGNTSVTVDTGGSCQSYTLTPGSAAGYVSPPSITNSQGSGSSVVLCGGDSVTFNINYSPVASGCLITSFSASPASVNSGQGSTLSWTTSGNCGEAYLDGPYENPRNVSSSLPNGSLGTGALSSSQTYTLSASNGNTSDSKSVTVTVGLPSSVCTITGFSASPSSVSYGQASALNWTTNGNCTSATLSGGQYGAGLDASSALPNNGASTNALTQTTTYTFYAANGNSNDTKTTTVTVGSGISTITVNNNTGSTWRVNGIAGSGTGAVDVFTGGGGTVTISYDAAAGHDYPPTVTNSVTGTGSSFYTSGGSTESFTLNYATSFDYSLSASTVSPNPIVRGGGNHISYGQGTVTKTLVSGTTKPVNISVTGYPLGSGVSVESISSQGCTPTCTSTVTFAVTSSAPVGTFPLTVTGDSPSHSTTMSLVIEKSPDVQIACSVSPQTPVFLGDPVNWKMDGTPTGGVPPYTSYTWSGTGIPTTPAPTGTSYTATYSTIGNKFATVTVEDSLGNTGTCTNSVPVKVVFNPKFKEI
jgi:hypothetical protein